jgi:membrane-bound lytic murein transglycosylase F
MQSNYLHGILYMMKKIQIGIGLAMLVILFGVIVFVHQGKTKARDLPKILESGRLTVVTDSSSIGFSIKGDSVFGLQYEIVKAFADTMGLELVITEKHDTKACMDGLINGDYDIVASFIPVTTEWKSDALFTKPFFTSRQVLVQQINVDSTHQLKIKKLSDLANETIYIPENSPFGMRIKHLSDEIATPINILEMKDVSPERMVHLVALGKIKYTICDEQFAQKLKMRYPNLDMLIPIGFEQHQAWAVPVKSVKLLNELNDFLTDFVGSAAYWKIYRKYF